MSGVKVLSETRGAGRPVAKGDEVCIRSQFFLSCGDPVSGKTETTFVVGRRHVIAGLEYGVVGMMVGGTRRIRISPHLAYGETGVPWLIPPNAVLICEVEIVSIAG